MIDPAKQTTEVLRLVYAIAVRGSPDSDIDIVVSRAMDSGLYTETFRACLCDPGPLCHRTLFRELRDLDPGDSQLDDERIDRIYISYILRQACSDEASTLKTVNKLVERTYLHEFHRSLDFMGLQALWSIYYQWSEDRDWLFGQQLRDAERTAVQELRAEAARWLAKHGTPDPLEGL